MVATMLDCAKLLEQYSDYRDDLLDPEARTEVLAHLAMCPACARYDRVVRKGVTLLHQLPEPRVSEDFMDRLQHRIYHLEAEARPWDRRSSTARAGAIAWLPVFKSGAEPFLLPPMAAHAPPTPAYFEAPAASFEAPAAGSAAFASELDWVGLMLDRPNSFPAMIRYEGATGGGMNAHFAGQR
jgi:anti-sigma factor RsiW